MSRACLASRVATDKLLGTTEMDPRVEIWEAGLAGEPLGTAALSRHLPLGLACASSLLLCPVTLVMKTLNIFTFTLT